MSGPPTTTSTHGAPGGASTSYAPTSRTTLRRRPHRAEYDREAVHAVLDEALLAHVGVLVDGAPRVIPCAYVRVGEALYFHGSTANRTLRALAGGEEACVTVTLLDGLVLARSAFHHSMNYRSVVAFGRGEKVTDAVEHARSLSALVEHIVPGRSPFVREPDAKEMLQTLVVRFPLEEVSMKHRAGDPIDDEADHSIDVWAGVLPLALVPGRPVPDSTVATPAEVPGHVLDWKRPS